MLFSCSKHSGVVIEDGNAVSGIVYGVDSVPQSNVEVYLIPWSYDPTTAHISALITDTTNETGHYFFDEVLFDEYRLFSERTQMSGAVSETVGKIGSNDTVSIDLYQKEYGSILFKGKNLATHINGFFYIPGTFFIAPITNSDSLILTEVYAGEYDEVVFVDQNGKRNTGTGTFKVVPHKEVDISDLIIFD